MHAIDERPYIEFLAGRAVPKVSPKTRHSLLQARLCVLMFGLVGDRGDVGTEWRFWLNSARPRTSLVPDLAFVAKGRIAALPEAQREQPPFAPDIAIEIRSPGDRLANIEWKMRAYLGGGTVVALDILPKSKIIRAFSAQGMREFRIDDEFECEAVPWLRFSVAEVFAGL